MGGFSFGVSYIYIYLIVIFIKCLYFYTTLENIFFGFKKKINKFYSPKAIAFQ